MGGGGGVASVRTSNAGLGWGHEIKLVGVRRGSPIPQRLEPSVRLPTYKKWSKIVAAAFIPRPKSGFCPTSWTFWAVPGVVAFNSPVPASTIQIAASTTVNRDFILSLRLVGFWVLGPYEAKRPLRRKAKHFFVSGATNTLHPFDPLIVNLALLYEELR